MYFVFELNYTLRSVIAVGQVYRNFAHISDVPALNGGSPGLHSSLAPPQAGKGKGKATSKPATGK